MFLIFGIFSTSKSAFLRIFIEINSKLSKAYAGEGKDRPDGSEVENTVPVRMSVQGSLLSNFQPYSNIRILVLIFRVFSKDAVVRAVDV